MNMNMYVYRVTEKPDSESVGEPGEPFEAFNLSEAKRISTRRQKVKGSVLLAGIIYLGYMVKHIISASRIRHTYG